MTSQRWGTQISASFFALVLAASGSASAQWSYPATTGYPVVSQSSLQYGAFPGYSSVGSSSWGAGSGVGSNIFIGFPAPGYAQSLGEITLTTTSWPAVANSVALVPGWDGSGYRAHRRVRARSAVARAANLR
jgi:hypothetical protein